MAKGTYRGQENATVDRVVRYLRENYRNEDGVPLSEQRLLKLVIKHADLISTAIQYGSFAYFPGDRIADAEGRLEWAGVGSEPEED